MRPRDVYSNLVQHPKKFHRATYTTPEEFEECFMDLKEYVEQARGSNIVDLQRPGRKSQFTTRNRILLVWMRFHWCEITLVFGVDQSYLTQATPHCFYHPLDLSL